ncbi:MAG TPA: sulfurtransferase [Candidatus Dormibacteraeota bacterium]|nr:sulfurtransferase [Candidatus Dormibacteraeota bacterium]
MQIPGPLIDVDWLAEHLTAPWLRIVDFRWYLDGRSGRAAYASGHLPGAVFVDLEEVSGARPNAGRHPLPEPEQFARAMRAAGVNRDTTVVVYDDQGGMVAARLWWMLRYFGHDAVAVLDGGLQAWRGELSTEPVAPTPGDFVVGQPRHWMQLDYEAVRTLPPGTVLLDARAPERYRGEVEPIDPRAGHIPGARNAYCRDNLDGDLRFKAAPELRERFARLGVEAGAEVVAYCGSGVSACHDLLALELAGLPGARLYVGSWSDWSARPDAPVATGAEPS